MLPSSCKQKGRNLQNKIAEDLREAFRLSSSDCRPAIMGESGCDVKLSEAARAVFPYAIECKCTEALQIWAALEQAKANAVKEGLNPALVFKRNRSDVYVCEKWKTWLSGRRVA